LSESPRKKARVIESLEGSAKESKTKARGELRLGLENTYDKALEDILRDKHE
jgi:hypothetical protein